MRLRFYFLFLLPLFFIFPLISVRSIDNQLTLKTKNFTANIPQKNFSQKTNPQINLVDNYIPSSSPVFRFFQNLINNQTQNIPLKKRFSVSIYDRFHQKISDKHILFSSSDDYHLQVSLDKQFLVPGKYQVEITNLETSEIVKQDFTWGVLAINPNKSVYSLNDLATFSLAVLDDNGNMVCDAQLNLTITSPSQKSTSPKITVNPECSLHDYTTIPDYQTQFQTSEIGQYQIHLSATTKNGTYSLDDSFQVEASPNFDIERITATRIYPIKQYPVTLKITPHQNFSGTITDIIPLTFKITDTKAKITTTSTQKILTWEVNLTANQTTLLTYTYDAPDKSPDIFTLGPITLTSTADASVYTQPRLWQIANDATNDVILMWDTSSGSVPAGWTCISCGAGDPYYGVFPRGAATYGASIGGTDTHKHTATFSTQSVGTSGSSRGAAGTAIDVYNHVHTWNSPLVANGDVRPPFKHLNLIYASNPTSIPNFVIGIFDNTNIPNGWTEFSAINNYYLRGYSDNTIGGSATHNHAIGVTSSSVGTSMTDSGNNSATGATAHTHSLSGFAATAANAPPFVNVVFAYNSSGNDAPIPNNLIALFNAAVPTNWTNISSAAPYNGNFLRGDSVNVGDTGGSSANHNHGGSAQIYSATGGAAYGNAGNTGALFGAGIGHTHAVTYTIGSTGSLPVYRDTIFGKYTNQAPTLPTLISPPSGATSVSTLTTFKTQTSDTESDILQYEIKICTNAGMSTGCNTFTAANTGWSGADIGTSSFSSGTTATFILDTGNSLTPATTYYWKTRAIDPDGSNTYSSTQTTAFSFTTSSSNQDPNTPTNSSPASGTGGVVYTPTLSASAFSDPDAGDTQNASQWQVATDSGFSSIVFDTGTTGSAANSVTVTTTLSVGTTYYWKVRYQDNHNAWSAYSSYTNFTTNKIPNQPTNSTPSNLATGVTTSPTLSASTFSDPDAGDTQNASQWQVATDSGFSSIVFDTGTTGSASNSVTVTTTLGYSTVYYWHARYRDNQNNWSSYSTTTSFTTVSAPNQAPNTPTLIIPANGSTNQAVAPSLRSVTTDPDTDVLQYEFKYCTNSGMSVGCTTVTAANTGWSGADIGTSSYNSGSTATFVIAVANSLPENQTIYWKTRAIDPSGSNTYSSTQASAFSFTTGSRPNAPTLDTPDTGTTGVSLTPDLKTTTTDPNSDPLKYKIDICTNAGMTIGCNTYDQTISTTGWSASNYASGAQATYTLQSSLTIGTTYYWRTYAIDYSGLNRWSNTQSPNWFVTTPGNQKPSIPTLISPSTGTTNSTITPSFRSVSTDPDSDILQYQLQVCTNSNMSTGCNTFTAANTGWSGADIGTSSYNSGSTATYVLQTGNSLAEGTTYYWKTQSIDPIGTNILSGTQTTPFSLTTGSRPNTPTLDTPGTGTTGVSSTPTLYTTSTDPNSDTLKYKIELCTNLAMSVGCTTYDQTISTTGWSASSYSSGSQANYTLQTSLGVGSTYYWRSSAIDTTGLNRWSSTQGSPSSFVTASVNNSPNTPTNSSPASGTGGVVYTPTLSASAFSDPDAGDTQNASQWQVATDSGFSSIVFDTGTTGSAANSTNISNLSIGTTYYWHVRYQDNHNAWSSYSTTTNFTTNKAPNTPSNSSPGIGVTGVSTTPTLSSSAFSDPDAGNTQNAAQWQVSTQTGGAFSANIVFDSNTDASHLTSINVSPALNSNSVYYWRVRHRDNVSEWSSYSSITSFTTQIGITAPPSAPVIFQQKFSFNEGYGNATYDQSTRKLAANISSATWDINCKVNKCLSFDGSNSKLDIASTAGLDFGSTAFTISAWIYPTSTVGVRSIFSTSKGIFYVENGLLKYQKSTPGWETIYSSTTIPTNQWSQVIFSRSGVGVNESFLYINGVLDKLGQIPDLGTGATNPGIGHENANGRFFQGKIDELKIFPNSISPFQAKIEVNQGSTISFGAAQSYSAIYCPPGDTTCGGIPLVELNLDEGVGTSVYDASGNSNHAFLTNNPVWNKGKIGKSLTFNGSSNYLSISNTLSTIKTISFWIKPSNTTQHIADFDGGTHDISVTSGTLSANGFTTPSIYVNSISTNQITPNVWQYITITTNTGFNGTATTFAKSLTNYYTGSIDQIRIYNYVRSAAEIAWDFNRGAPVAWYKMDDCGLGGTQVADWSGFTNHAFLTIGPVGTQNSAGNCSTSSTAFGVGSTGKFNSSINFDGNDDYLAIKQAVNNIQSISFWIKPASTTQSIVDLDGGTHKISLSSGTVSATGFATPSIYVDGQLNGTVSNTNWHLITITTATPFNSTTAAKIGVITSTYYSGKIDDLRIYNYPLNLDQIKLIFTNGATNLGSPTL